MSDPLDGESDDEAVLLRRRHHHHEEDEDGAVPTPPLSPASPPPVAPTDELFEIVDHTSASPWERFIAQLENALHLWHLDTDPDKPKQRKRHSPGFASTTLTYEGTSLLLGHFLSRVAAPDVPVEEVYADCDDIPAVLRQQLGNLATDFTREGLHAHIQRWFGLDEFLVLVLTAADTVTQNMSQLLVSSMAIALHNVKCTIPVFVQSGESWKCIYDGYSLCDGVEVRYHTVVQNYIPRTYAHLSGIADLFASKLSQGSMLSRSALRIRCSVRYSFNISNWFNEDWRAGNVVDAMHDCSFAWGPRTDPLEFIQLGATWPDFAEDTLNDNAVYSDFQAHDAPVWMLCRQLRKRVSHPLSDVIETLVSTLAASLDLPEDEQHEPVATSHVTGTSIDGHLQHDEFAGHPRTVASGVSGSTRLKGVMDNTISNVMGRGPAIMLQTAEELELIRQALFAPGRPIVHHELNQGTLLKLSKTCPKDSLGWYIAMYVTLDLSDASLKRLAVLWNTIVREVRLHWENATPLLRVNDGPPDLHASLLHQKLQLLNYCIRRKRQSAPTDSRRKPAQPAKQSASKARRTTQTDAIDLTADIVMPGMRPRSNHVSAGDDEDVFYDTTEDFFPAIGGQAVETTNDLFMTSTAVKGLDRVGADRPLPGVFLVNHPTELVYVPVTQEVGHMTEDMLEEQQAVYERLGATADGTLGRAKLQAAFVQSDMEAFKAANPDATLVDFVRWHSPNDWITDGEGDDPAPHLSKRMTEPGNLWAATWELAHAVPASKQRAVFNFEQEALKIIHFLENLSVVDLLTHVAPTAFVIAHDSLAVQQRLMTFAPVARHWQHFQQRLQAVNWGDLSNSVGDLHTVVASLRRSELIASTALSLLHKFGSQQHLLIERLLASREVRLMSDAERNVTAELFTQRGGLGVFAEPPLREFILRGLSPQPSPASRPLIHRLYASLSESEFRLTEAFSQDTVFV